MTVYYAEDYEVLPEGPYPAKLARIDEGDEPGPFGDFLTWTFTAAVPQDGDAPRLVEVTGRTSTSFKPTTKARTWYESLLGSKVAKGDAIDFGMVIGTPCTVYLSVVEKEKGTFNRIESIRRRQVAQAAAPVAAVIAAAADDPALDELPF